MSWEDRGFLNVTFGVANYFYWFLLANFYFLLTNVLIIEVYLNFELTFANLPIFLIALIPTGFSITAMCSLMGKLIREKHINVTRDFIRFYLMGIKETFKIWIPSLLTIFSLALYGRFIDLEIVHWVVTILIILKIGFLLMIFPIMSRFSFLTRDLIKIAFYYFFKKMYLPLAGIGVLLAAYLALTSITYYFILVIGSTIFYFLILMLQDVLREIENKYIENT